MIMALKPGVLASWRENSKIWCGRMLISMVGLITIAAIIPYGAQAQTVTLGPFGLDKMIHFIGFACMTLLALGAGSGRPFWRRAFLVILVPAFGVAIEWAQVYLPYRTFNPVDILANGCGVGFGLLLAQSAKQMNRVRRRQDVMMRPVGGLAGKRG